MKNFNFHEKKDIKNMITQGFVDETNYKITIGNLALYNLKVLNMNKEDNYDAIKEYMTLHARDFFEAEYQTIIYREISTAKKRILRDIDGVYITQSELEHISALNDIRKEKIAFVLVATAKYYDAIKNTDGHYTNLTNAEMCKLARVTMRTADRDAFMAFLYDDGIVVRHMRPNGTGKQVNIISKDDEDPTVLSLNQIDFQELAYQYLNWKNGGGFDRCVVCGRLIKHRPNIKYCEACGKLIEREQTQVRVQKFREKM